MKKRSMTPELLPQGAGYGLQYWKDAAAQLGNVKILVFAALIIALRVVVKNPFCKISLMPGLHLTMDCYVNALGAMIFGPVVGFLSGAVSDTLGCILFPSPEPYFFPYILVEMLSSFIFGVFLWRRKLSVNRVLLSKFAVNVVCNLLVNPAITKLYYVWLGDSTQTAYAFVTAVRVGKNLVLFPLEAALIVLFVSALFPLLRRVGVVPRDQAAPVLKWKHWVMLGVLTVIAVGLIVFYAVFLKDFLSEHNIKLF